MASLPHAPLTTLELVAIAAAIVTASLLSEPFGAAAAWAVAVAIIAMVLVWRRRRVARGSR